MLEASTAEALDFFMKCVFKMMVDYWIHNWATYEDYII